GQAHSADRDAGAAQDHETPLVREPRRLVHEAGLADAGLARDQDMAGATDGDAVEGRGGELELCRSSDEDGAHAPSGHRRIIRAGWAGSGTRSVRRTEVRRIPFWGENPG